MTIHIVDGVWSESANTIELERPDWQSRSNCRGKTDLFFATATGRKATEHLTRAERMAKQICAECKVKDECLQFALDADERHGVWGGLNTIERDIVRDGVALGAKRGRRTPQKRSNS